MKLCLLYSSAEGEFSGRVIDDLYHTDDLNFEVLDKNDSYNDNIAVFPKNLGHTRPRSLAQTLMSLFK